jgi:isopenicillin-N N-acyltransferase-like protein
MTGKQLPPMCWAASVLAVFLATAAGVGAGEFTGPAFLPQSCPGGALSVEAGVPVLQVAGSPETMGRAAGTLVREQARFLMAHYLDVVIPRPLQPMALNMVRSMEPHIPPRYLEELAGLAEGAGETREHVFLAATFLDLYRSLGCSGFVAVPPATADGPLLARNLDFATLGVAQHYSLVIVYHPQGFDSFLSVAWPGLPGVVSGMNEAGLVLVMMEVDDPDRGLAGIPYQLLYRRVLEECQTVADAEQLIRLSPRTVSNNVLLLDRKGEAAVLEVSRSVVTRRGAEGGLLWVTNHFRARGPVAGLRCWRYETLGRELRSRRGPLRVSEAAELLGMVHQGSLTMQSMVFLPEAMKLHVAFGEPPTTSGRYVELDAQALFAWPLAPTAGEKNR